MLPTSTPSAMTHANSWLLNPEGRKSYATRETLVKKVEALGFSHIRHLIVPMAVTGPSGEVTCRWTAVFTGPEANPVIFHGFAWFG